MSFAQPDNPPRFVADENFNQLIVDGLRRTAPSIDIITASEAGLLHAPDPDVLVWAAQHDRILLSHDKRTMPDHFYHFLSRLAHGASSPGVMLLSQEFAIGRSIEAVLEIWRLSAHEEWRNLLIRLPL